MIDCPKIDDAPGLKWRRLKNGWQAIWRARSDLVRRGYMFKSRKVWEGSWPDAFDIANIQEQCQSIQAEMLAWGRDDYGYGPQYDGTWGSLIKCYQTDPDSPYRKNEYASRRHYDTLCRILDREIGNERIEAIDTRRVLRLHDKWTEPKEPGGARKIAMGHALVGMMRGVLTFGATLLKCPACRELRVDLHSTRFKAAKPREVHLSADHVIAIRKEAHRMTGPFRHSIALAQAFQFDVASGMRQKDIIGEWVPISEPGVSEIISGNQKWLKGLRGEEIDEDFILRHLTWKRKKMLVADLKLAPMVMEEIRIMVGATAADPVTRDMLPRSGPLIVNEQTRLPYHVEAFRTAWREIARKVGVPDEIKNMDTRSGAITEALAAGAPLEAVRKGATHSNISMTNRYSRGDADAVVTVMQHRAASRNKPKT